MNPLTWLREQWARIRATPARLTALANRAHAILSDSSLPRELRERAGRVWADALQDRAEAERILSSQVREADAATLSRTELAMGVPLRTSLDVTIHGLAALGAIPYLVIVGSATAAAVAAALVAIFGRESAYERELALIESGAASARDIERLREGAPAAGGVSGAIHEAAGMLKVVLVGALAFGAYRLATTRGR